MGPLRPRRRPAARTGRGTACRASLTEYPRACVRWGLRRGWDVPFLVLLVIAVVVIVLVVRASNAPGRRPGGANLPRPPRSPNRAPGTGRPVAPDDDPEFLAELERRARRDDGTKNA